MKKIKWERVRKIEYSARRASLKHPEVKLGKDMLFLIDSLALLKLQNQSLNDRISEMLQIAPFLKTAVFNKKPPADMVTNVNYPVTANVEEINVLETE
jgi:hypothetical protein